MMSQENALQFVLHVAKDPIISGKVIDAIRVGDVDHILILAQEAGFNFTRNELRSTLSTYINNYTVGGRLTTQELESVIGAGSDYAGYQPTQNYQFILNLHNLWPT
jgi:predicted ribosomally synthesized peptide with nif11-like leader